MNTPLRRFEMDRLCDALEEARRERGLMWVELMAEINRVFKGTTSIPITLSTVRGMAKKSSVTSGVVLQILRWLGRSPESFLAGGGAARDGEKLPEPGPGRVLRFDTRAMHEALDAERRVRGLTWTQVASELPGFTESMLTNLATGPLIGFPRVMMLTQWLGQPAAHFVRVRAK